LEVGVDEGAIFEEKSICQLVFSGEEVIKGWGMRSSNQQVPIAQPGSGGGDPMYLPKHLLEHLRRDPLEHIGEIEAIHAVIRLMDQDLSQFCGRDFDATYPLAKYGIILGQEVGWKGLLVQISTQADLS
jgi:hypothetical protein